MFKKLFKRKTNNKDTIPTAYPINFVGRGIYKKSFQSAEFGVVFEDDGKTGYFYATDRNHTQIFDTLLLYNYSDNFYVPEGQVFIVLNESLKKAGIFYENKFQAVFDFENKRGYSRLKTTDLKLSKWLNSYEWNDKIIFGLG